MKGNEEVGEHLFGIGDFISFFIRVRGCSERRENQVSKMRRRFHSSGGHGRAYEENAVICDLSKKRTYLWRKEKEFKKGRALLFPFYVVESL